MTTTITGRSIWTQAPTATIRRTNRYGEEPEFVVHNIELRENERDGTFSLKSRAVHGVDEEHDASYVFTAEGAGLKFGRTDGMSVEFSGVLLEVSHYPEGQSFEEGSWILGNRGGDGVLIVTACEARYCKDDDCVVMPYLPPRVEYVPKPVTITLDFRAREEDLT